jgi:hypothetical protein
MHMESIPVTISLVELLILLGVWLNTVINVYKFIKE